MWGQRSPWLPIPCRTDCRSTSSGWVKLALNGAFAEGMLQSALAPPFGPREPCHPEGNHSRAVRMSEALAANSPPSRARTAFPSQANWDVIHPIFHNDCNPSTVYSSMEVLQLEPRALNIQMMPLAELVLQRVNCQLLLCDLCSLFPTQS